MLPDAEQDSVCHCQRHAFWRQDSEPEREPVSHTQPDRDRERDGHAIWLRLCISVLDSKPEPNRLADADAECERVAECGSDGVDYADAESERV